VGDSNDDIRKALNDLAGELARAAEQGGRIVREAMKDVRGWASGSPPPAPGPGPSPVEAIRELGKLRDAGLLSEDEFQAKKIELLGRI
jgi:Short C-terminal domain